MKIGVIELNPWDDLLGDHRKQVCLWLHIFPSRSSLSDWQATMEKPDHTPDVLRPQ